MFIFVNQILAINQLLVLAEVVNKLQGFCKTLLKRWRYAKLVLGLDLTAINILPRVP